ncbi:MAG: porin family protein [Acidobacteria bacterium]|nr:porin family protein [Acidobacteriota bacterium]
MVKRCVIRTAGITLLLIVLSAAAAAQRIEFGPFIGARLGGNVDVIGESAVDEYGVKADIAYGFNFGVAVTDRIHLEFLWSRQATEWDPQSLSGAAPDFVASELNVDLYHFSLLYHWRDVNDPVRPYFIVGAGATRFSDFLGTGGDTRFSLSAGGGLKLYVSKNFGFRLQARWTPTRMDTTPDIVCDSFGYCWSVERPTYLQQVEFSGGLILRF